jgi:hypothetical protein
MNLIYNEFLYSPVPAGIQLQQPPDFSYFPADKNTVRLGVYSDHPQFQLFKTYPFFTLHLKYVQPGQIIPEVIKGGDNP